MLVSSIKWRVCVCRCYCQRLLLEQGLYPGVTGQGTQQAEQGLLSQHAAPACAAYHTQHWCSLRDMQQLHSHRTASLHLQHYFHATCEDLSVLISQWSASRVHWSQWQVTLTFGPPRVQEEKKWLKRTSVFRLCSLRFSSVVSSQKLCSKRDHLCTRQKCYTNLPATKSLVSAGFNKDDSTRRH